MVGAGDDPQWGNACPIARRRAGVGALPLKAMECDFSTSQQATEMIQIPRALLERFTEALCYAA
jgi:hypothetical protein